jgi:acyl-homoserine-lactone acylase
MPLVVDPPSGWLQSTNDPPWSATWPAANDGKGAWPEGEPRTMGLRTARSIRLLLEHPRMTLASLIEAKYSTRMELADRVLDDLLAAAREVATPEVRRGVATLAQWDRRADAQSRGAVLFEAFARDWSGSAKGSPFATPWNAAHPIDTPDGLADAAQAVAALARAVVDVEARYGHADVAWGDVYRYRQDALDLAANGGPGDALGIFTSIRYAGGSADPTSKTQSAVFGDTYIAAVEFSSPVRARVLLTYGNASRHGSPHARDQLSLFGKKELRTAWRTRKEVLAHLAPSDRP